MTGVGGLDRIDREDAEGIDGFGFKRTVERGGSDGGQENLLERRRGKRKHHAAGGMRQTASGVSPVTGKYPMSRAGDPRRAGACRPLARCETCAAKMAKMTTLKELALTAPGKDRTRVALLRRIRPADRG